MVGVSADSQERNDEFRKALELPYALVGDPNGDVLRAYGVRVPVLGLARRVTYVIGRDGKIGHIYSNSFDAEVHVAKTCALVESQPARLHIQ